LRYNSRQVVSEKETDMKTARILAVVLVVFTAFAAYAQETPEQHDARMAWWREAKFGMFIHWGLYAIPAGVWNGKDVDTAGEWIMFGAKIPPAEYEPLVKQFNPEKFDAARWVEIAKDAGMKYMVITSKHHEGFALFDSKVSDYDVMATPFHRDILKELSTECGKEGVKMCWYHSILDWHHPDYLPRGEGSPRPWDTRSKEGASYDRYIEYMKGQLRELLTNYGPIGVLWFDGGWEHSPEEHHSREVVDMIRSIQPQIIINNRIQLPLDFDTPEQQIPDTGIPGRDWETCMTMNDTWGYKVHDKNWKSTETLLHNLVDIVSKGGNYLLNVGPTAEGEIPEESVQRLAEIGKWMKVNGDSIYGTTASPFRGLKWGRCTTKGSTLYLHVFNWPADGNLVVPGLQTPIKAAYLLSDGAKSALQASAQDEDMVVKLPSAAPDAIDSVVVLTFDGAPSVLPFAVAPEADGSLSLRAADATIHGETAKYERGEKKNNIGMWTDSSDWVDWMVKTVKLGKYEVRVVYGCPENSAGSTYTVSVDGQETHGVVAPTASWDDYKTETIGTVSIDTPGRHSVSVKPTQKPSLAVMNLREVILLPKAD
jgi:alpha-L-fucosidase